MCTAIEIGAFEMDDEPENPLDDPGDEWYCPILSTSFQMRLVDSKGVVFTLWFSRPGEMLRNAG